MPPSSAARGAQKLTTGERIFWEKINEVVNVLCNLWLQCVDSSSLTMGWVMKWQFSTWAKPSARTRPQGLTVITIITTAASREQAPCPMQCSQCFTWKVSSLIPQLPCKIATIITSIYQRTAWGHVDAMVCPRSQSWFSAGQDSSAGDLTPKRVCLTDTLPQSFQGRVKENVTLETNSEPRVTNSREEAGEVSLGVHKRSPWPWKMLNSAQTQAPLTPSQRDHQGAQGFPVLLICPLLCMEHIPLLFPQYNLSLSHLAF